MGFSSESIARERMKRKWFAAKLSVLCVGPVFVLPGRFHLYATWFLIACDGHFVEQKSLGLQASHGRNGESFARTSWLSLSFKSHGTLATIDVRINCNPHHSISVIITLNPGGQRHESNRKWWFLRARRWHACFCLTAKRVHHAPITTAAHNASSDCCSLRSIETHTWHPRLWYSSWSIVTR